MKSHKYDTLGVTGSPKVILQDCFKDLFFTFPNSGAS